MIGCAEVSSCISQRTDKKFDESRQIFPLRISSQRHALGGWEAAGGTRVRKVGDFGSINRGTFYMTNDGTTRYLCFTTSDFSKLM